MCSIWFWHICILGDSDNKNSGKDGDSDSQKWIILSERVGLTLAGGLLLLIINKEYLKQLLQTSKLCHKHIKSVPTHSTIYFTYFLANSLLYNLHNSLDHKLHKLWHIYRHDSPNNETAYVSNKIIKNSGIST